MKYLSITLCKTDLESCIIKEISFTPTNISKPSTTRKAKRIPIDHATKAATEVLYRLHFLLADFMSWFLTNLISAFLLPPLNLFILTLFGLLIWRTRPAAAKLLISTSFLILWLISTPFFSECLLRTLETPPAVFTDEEHTADAIIVLGGSIYANAPEYEGDTVSSDTLARLRYAAKITKDLNKPLLLSGGAPLGNNISEAMLMKSVLTQELNTPVEWIENHSNNTFENAHFSYNLLQKYGIKRIYLVTHAWHMPRAKQTFETAGFKVIPAAMGYTTRHKVNMLAFLPNAGALQNSQIFAHEVLGILWYKLKF